MTTATDNIVLEGTTASPSNAIGPYRAFDPEPSGHCRALDGVRGLAILLVFCYDCLKIPNDGRLFSLGIRTISGAGWTGVDLFFVLSGFLITGILLDTRGRERYFSSFFGRRAVRIFPLYYLSLILAFWVIPAVVGSVSPQSPLVGELATLRQDQGWFWSYLQNWMMVGRGSWSEISYLNHFWSLAIEEQFYFAWPIVVALLSRRRLTQLSIGQCLLALGLRCGLLWQGFDKVVLHACTFTRMDSLCLGALAAIAIRDAQWSARLRRLALPCFCGLAILLFGLDRWRQILQSGTPWAQTAGHSLLGLMYASLIFWAASLRDETWSARALSLAPLALLGQFSYALYVLHRPVHALVKQIPLRSMSETEMGLIQFALTLGGSLVVAAISWHLIEKRCLAWKRHFPRPVPTSNAVSFPAAKYSEEEAEAARKRSTSTATV
ncbi:MAG: acyltransferase [Planctomycetaceae bacterium]